MRFPSLPRSGVWQSQLSQDLICRLDVLAVLALIWFCNMHRPPRAARSRAAAREKALKCGGVGVGERSGERSVMIWSAENQAQFI